MDTMSFGNTIGFCMELSEKGLWDNGLRFGDAEDLEELVKMTAYREGIGNEIAEGVRNLSEKYGGEEFAIHVKGLEIAAYEPRAAQGMGLGYATANRGGCHLNGGYLVVLEGLGLRVSGRSTIGKAGLTIFFQDLMEAVSASGICLFSTYAVLPSALVKKPKSLVSRIACAVFPLLGSMVGFIHNHSSLLGINVPGMIPYPFAYMLVTGFHTNIGKYVKAGERIYNLERSVNVRQGMRDADKLPKRLTSELQDSNDPKSLVRLDVMLKRYYDIRGWDKHGVPKKKRLKKLGL
jgi:aldehyde:ferredoxin oxidoreductase